MPSPTHSQITVNLNVNVDATGNIEVFGSPADSASNVIIATAKLPVNALYDGTKNGTLGAGLIEFWEPSSDLGNVFAKLADSDAFDVNGADSYETAAKVLACGLQNVLVDDLDCTNASPFSESKYGGANASNYRMIPGFGRLALSVYAHYLFGHSAATAAITNDETFMTSMLSLTSGSASVKDGGRAADRYTAWTKKSEVDGGLVASWSGAQSSSDANLAIALVKAIVKKGTDAPLSSTRSSAAATAAGAVNGTGTLANIVKQVIGLDATRAMDQDNNELAPEVHQILRFIEGDKIRVNITLDAPTVLVSGSAADQAAQQGEPATSKYDKELSTAGIQKETYTIEITLGPRSAEYDLPPVPTFIRYGTGQTLLTPVDTTKQYGLTVDGVDKYVQIRSSFNYDANNNIISYAFAELSSNSTISIKYNGTAYNISNNLVNTFYDSNDGINNMTKIYTLTTSASSLLSITDNGLYFIRIGETNDANTTPLVGLTKVNNISLIGAAVSGWNTDVQLSRVSEYVYEMSNVQFTSGNEFKIRTNNAWSNSTFLDFESDNITNVDITINGNINMSFSGVSGAYDVKLYFTDLKKVALELTPYVAPPSNPINITSVNTSSRQINWNVESVPSGQYELQYSTDGTTWNLACASGSPRIQGSLLSGLNDIPADISMSIGNEYGITINANYFSGLVNGVATYVSVPSNLSGVQFRAVLSNPDTWYQTGAFNKPTPKSPIEVVSNVFTVE